MIAPQLESLLPAEYQAEDKVWTIPTISFNAYHPDICYLLQDGKAFKGPLGDYHSAIAFAGFREGLSVDATARLFNEATYERLGYFQRWDAAREHLLDIFSRAGLDLRTQFVNWSRNDAFMYSNNHVQVRCLHDLAKEILRRAGKKPTYADVLPHDNLLNGPVYPIYPEIAQRLGVPGSYLFKPGGHYRFIRLGDFIAQSFDLYARNSNVSVLPEHSHRVDSAIDLLGKLP